MARESKDSPSQGTAKAQRDEAERLRAEKAAAAKEANRKGKGPGGS